MDFDKAVTDVFDLIASIAGKLTSTPEIPDVTGYDVSALLTDEELGDPALFFAPSDAVPDIRFRKSSQLPFVSVWEGSYPSPIETVFSENNTVYVKHFRLDGRKGAPVIVMLNGLHVDAAFDFYFEWWALRFASWGFETAMVTIPYSQRRTPEGSFSGQYLMTPETRWTLLSFRQSFADVQVFINWLNENGAGSVGLFGVSFGGVLSGAYACNASNADFAIMCMPPVDMADLFAKWDYADDWRRREAAGELTMLSDDRAHALMSLRRMKPRVPVKNMFMASGRYDHLVPVETVEATDAAWGGMPWLRVYPTGHINTFALNFRLIADLQRFLKKEIL
ncbi:MAG TPA: alpha/beta hydrolase family protein [bacterium]|nr:alpha/beta hydrolase family protein [bacterium]